MKTLTTSLGAVVVLSLLTLAPNTVFGQTTSTTTTVTSSGTVSELAPNAIAVKVDTSPTPVRYTFTKTTTYVDESGNPVSIETVKTGLPVTVYYEKSGDSFVADKVVVRKSVTTTTAPVSSTTSTTVTSSQPTPPTADGVVTDADSEHIDLRTPEAAKPIHYKAHEATAYVDERGNPVSRKMVSPGTPVTIFYEQSEDNLLATRVIVKSPALLER